MQQVSAKAHAVQPMLAILDTLDREMKYLEQIVADLDQDSRALALQVGLPEQAVQDRQPTRLLRNW